MRSHQRLWRALTVLLLISGSVGGVLGNCENIPMTRGYLDAFRGGFPMPALAAINRQLGLGTHPYLTVLPWAAQSPAMARVEPDETKRRTLLENSKVRIAMTPDYAHIDDSQGVIVVSWWYYHLGANTHLYLDLLHELTHLRQLRDGANLWDPAFGYAQRPTEMEAYTVAVEEARRLHMGAQLVSDHLHNPLMTEADVTGLLAHIDATLGAP